MPTPLSLPIFAFWKSAFPAAWQPWLIQPVHKHTHTETHTQTHTDTHRHTHIWRSNHLMGRWKELNPWGSACAAMVVCKYCEHCLLTFSRGPPEDSLHRWLGTRWSGHVSGVCSRKGTRELIHEVMGLNVPQTLIEAAHTQFLQLSVSFSVYGNVLLPQP